MEMMRRRASFYSLLPSMHLSGSSPRNVTDPPLLHYTPRSIYWYPLSHPALQENVALQVQDILQC